MYMSKPDKTRINSLRSCGRWPLFCLAFAGLIAAAPVQADREDRQGPRQHQGQGDGSARAAAIAQSRYGGKVLKVTSQGGSYRVRLLLPDGTVKSVTVGAGD